MSDYFYILVCLKKIAAILLLGILLFNWCGYRLLSSLMEFNANATLEAKLDEGQYNQNDLIQLRIPAENLGYYINSATFDRVVGQIEINGVHYNYFKRRLYHDTLELLCIRNQEMTQLNKANNEFLKFNNDLQQESQSKKNGRQSHVSKIFSQDIFNIIASYKLSGPARPAAGIFVQFVEVLSSLNLGIPGKPPEHPA